MRAYLGDVAGLLQHAARLGHVDATRLDLRTLRSWLAKQQTVGRSRTTLARRATAARVFTAWLLRTGRAESDAGASLGSPKAHPSLPPVLRADEAADLIRTAARLADDGSPVGIRDVAMLELLYATGIRVGELVGLDLDDVDRDRNVVRVLGKGRKERAVPFGHPAARALERWLAHGRPALRVEGAGAALFLGARGRRIDQRAVRTLVHRRIAEVPGAPDIGPHGTAAHRGHPPARGRRRPALGPGAARPRVPGDDAALHPRHHRPARGAPTSRHTPGPDRPGAPGWPAATTRTAARRGRRADHRARGTAPTAAGTGSTGSARHSGSSRTGPAPTSAEGSR